MLGRYVARLNSRSCPRSVAVIRRGTPSDGGVARLARGRSRTRPIVFGSDCCDHFCRARAGSLSMRGFRPRANGVITALIVAYGFASAPLTPFRYEFRAQRYCPADVIVWLDLGKGIYYSQRQRRYGRGFTRSLCAGRKPSAAAIAAGCSGCGRAQTKRTPPRSSAQGNCSVRWTT